jgi:hypothetical protein
MTAAERADQRMDALTVANAIRSANATLKRDIYALPRHEGSEKVAVLLEAPSGPVASMPIGRLLMCINGIGEQGMTRHLRAAGVFSTTKRVSALTPRQRQTLAHTLRHRDLVFPCWGGLS